MPGPMNGTPVTPQLAQADATRAGAYAGPLGPTAPPAPAPPTQADLSALYSRFAPGGNLSGPGGTAPVVQPPQPDPFGPYIAAFNASMPGARANIDQMLTRSLGELAGRRDAASKVVAGLPAQVGAAYDSATQGMAGGTAANNAAASIDPRLRGSAAGFAAPYQAALAQDKGGALAAQPFLNLATRTAYDTGQSALENSAYNARAGLIDKQQQFDLEIAKERAAQQQASNDRALQYAHDAQMAQTANQYQTTRDTTLHGYTVADEAAKLKAQADVQPAANPAQAQAGLSAGRVAAVKGTQQYKTTLDMLSQKDAQGRRALDPSILINHMRTSNPDLLTILQSEHPELFFNSDGKGGYNTQSLKSNLDTGGSGGSGFLKTGDFSNFVGSGNWVNPTWT